MNSFSKDWVMGYWVIGALQRVGHAGMTFSLVLAGCMLLLCLGGFLTSDKTRMLFGLGALGMAPTWGIGWLVQSGCGLLTGHEFSYGVLDYIGVAVALFVGARMARNKGQAKS